MPEITIGSLKAHLAVPAVGDGPWPGVVVLHESFEPAATLESALTRAGVRHDVKEYPEAGHSFLNRHDFGPGGALLRVAGVGYHGPSAEDAWQRILRFFEAQLRV